MFERRAKTVQGQVCGVRYNQEQGNNYLASGHLDGCRTSKETKKRNRRDRGESVAVEIVDVGIVVDVRISSVVLVFWCFECLFGGGERGKGCLAYSCAFEG
jgi:hypothetical protein